MKCLAVRWDWCCWGASARGGRGAGNRGAYENCRRQSAANGTADSWALLTSSRTDRYDAGMKTRRKLLRRPGSKRGGTQNPRVAIYVADENCRENQIFHGIVDYVNAHNPWTVYLHGQSDLWADVGTVRKLRLDGILTASTARGRVWKRQLNFIRAVRVPTVAILAEPMDSGLVEVIPDDIAVGKLAAEHLLDKGFRHFGYYGGDMPYARIRRDGFVAALQEKGHECSVHLRKDFRWGQLFREWEADSLGQWLSTLPHPTGIMACSDMWARHVVYAGQRLGLHIPEDVAVVGVDNREALCRIIHPKLSSIPLDLRKQGAMAAELLDRIMHGRKPGDRTVKVPPLPLVVRHSSDFLVVDDADISGAVRYIRENAFRPLTVDEVLDHTLISRRKLEMGFQRNFGRSPQREIWRVHVERAKQLLRETTMKMERISELSGFVSRNHFSRIFHREVGVTPRDWRDGLHLAE